MTKVIEPGTGIVTPRRIVLVSCGAQKLDRRAPARELYTSNLFQLSAKYADLYFDCWYVISAFHELVERSTLLHPYDRSIREKGKSEREAWASRIAGRLRGHEPGVSAGPGARLGGPGARTRVTLLAGEEYAKLLRPHIVAEEPLLGLQIGERLHWLHTRIDDLQTGGGDST